MLGIDAAQLSQFVEHTADLLMETFRQPPIYNVGQPFAWMNRKELAMTTSGIAKAAVTPTTSAKAGSAVPGAELHQVSEACVHETSGRIELQQMSNKICHPRPPDILLCASSRDV